MRGPLEIFGARTREEYLAKQAGFCYTRGKKPFRVTAEHPIAYVNEDRLLLDCSTKGCNNGVVVDAAWRLGCCMECGAIYDDVIVPDSLGERE